jgi:membrane protease YdiL (CAAX protease family)
VPAPFTSRQAGAFLRSVVPAEPAQWLLLIGSTLLLISHRLPWLSRFASLYSPAGARWEAYAYLLSWPLLFAGVGGYYLALVPGKRPTRRLVYWVLVPGAADIIAIIVAAHFRLAAPDQPFTSVLEQTDPRWWDELARTVLNLGSGIAFASAGVILVVVFLVLMRRGRASVPIRLVAEGAEALGPEQLTPRTEQRRIMTFVWAMICFVPLAWALEGYFVSMAWSISQVRRLDARVDGFGFTLISVVLAVVFVLLPMGKKEGINALKALRFSPIKYILLAFFFPLAVASVWPLLNYAYDRIQWASYQWGQIIPPTLASYFGPLRLRLLGYFLLALPEEVAWRGYLQPKFIRRYGAMRGIFFVGVVWAAFHFVTDSWGGSSSQALIHLATRIALVVALSYPLAWLVMKSRSIVPSVIGHAVYNITVAGYVIYDTPVWLTFLLLGATGYLMFRFDPPEAEIAEIPTEAEVVPELSAESESRGVETA